MGKLKKSKTSKINLNSNTVYIVNGHDLDCDTFNNIKLYCFNRFNYKTAVFF